MLIGGVVLMGLCVAFFVASALLSSSADPGMHEVGIALRAVIPYFLLAGGVVMLMYFIVSKVAGTPEDAKAPSMMFGHSTSMQEMRDDDAP